jgi:thiamine-phosphate pyrophosphorylase
VNAQPELYVTLEIAGGEAKAATVALEAILKAGPVACLLIRPSRDSRLDAGVAKSLIAQAQKRGIATLVADDANLARMLKADGVHLSWSKDIVKQFSEAREILGAHATVGADAGRSRDDAMELGEAGADYVAFGIPPHVEDRATAEGRQLDLIAWWSEIFELPCVACDVASAEHARDLAGDGADFIVVTISSQMTGGEIGQRIAGFTAAITPQGVTA